VAVLYHHGTNTRAYHEVDEPQHIDFDLDAAPALEQLLASYPKYVRVGALPCETAAQRLDVANALAEAHLILVKPASSRRPPQSRSKKRESESRSECSCAREVTHGGRRSGGGWDSSLSYDV